MRFGSRIESESRVEDWAFDAWLSSLHGEGGEHLTEVSGGGDSESFTERVGGDGSIAEAERRGERRALAGLRRLSTRGLSSELPLRHPKKKKNGKAWK